MSKKPIQFSSIRYQLNVGGATFSLEKMQSICISTMFSTLFRPREEKQNHCFRCDSQTSVMLMFICGLEIGVFHFMNVAFNVFYGRMTATCLLHWFDFICFNFIEQQRHWKCLKQFIQLYIPISTVSANFFSFIFILPVCHCNLFRWQECGWEETESLSFVVSKSLFHTHLLL